MADGDYILDNSWLEGRERLRALEDLLDPGTIAALAATGVEPGWRCLEVGAGGGTIAAWLADRVGPSGSVVATDLDTRYLAELAPRANLTLRRHDIVADPLEEGAFDLVHARLLLEHLPARDEAMRKLARATRPGGVVVIEAVDYAAAIPVSAHGAREHEHTQATRLRVFEEAGVRADHGRHLPAAMRAAGLVGVHAEGRVFVMEGGSPGARWFKLSMRQLRPRLVGPGKLTDAEVDRMLELFDDPSWSAYSPIILAAWGRRDV